MPPVSHDDPATDAEAADVRCDGCGLETPGGAAGCQAIFEEVLARDFSDSRYFGVHRMLVDTYSLQHPDRYCESAKSLVAHLCGLCQILEAGASPSVGDPALRRWLDGPSSLVKPELPAVRGHLTIASVRDAATPADHAAAVERWAAATWRAYAPLHDLAREWLERASSESSRSPAPPATGTEARAHDRKGPP